MAFLLSNWCITMESVFNTALLKKDSISCGTQGPGSRHYRKVKYAVACSLMKGPTREGKHLVSYRYNV